MAKDGEVAPPFQSLCVSRCTFSPPGSYEMADAVIEARKIIINLIHRRAKRITGAVVRRRAGVNGLKDHETLWG